MTSTTSKLRLSALAALLLSVACVSSRLDLPSDHPANAKARTAPLELASLHAQPAVAHHHGEASPAADTYTCPMHPEITQNAPGKCPKCGMNLVKKSSATPHAGH